MSQEHQLQNPADVEALFRYQLIAPLLDPLATPEEKRAWRQWVLGRTHQRADGTRRQVSERTLRRWVEAYRTAGWEGLKPATRRDKGQLRAFAPAILEQARQLKEEDPSRSVRQVVRMLEVGGAIPPGHVSSSTLWRHLDRLGLGDRQVRVSRPLRRFEAAAPNDLWQGDATHGPYLPDPHDPEKKRKTFLLLFLDDHSRLVCHAQFYWAEDLYALELCTQQALLRRGVPWRIYVDNGLIYQSTVFTRACAQLQIRHISASPYHPEGKGKIERIFRTIQEEVFRELHHHPVRTLQELNARLWAWIEEVYHVRVHEETGEPPAQRFAKHEAAKRPVSPEQLAAIFLWRALRKVDKTGVIQFQGNRYQAPPGLEGQRVEIRFHPLHLESVQVWLNDRYQGQAEALDLVANSLRDVQRAHRLDPDKPKRTSGLPYLELLVQRQEARKRQALSPLRMAEAEDKARLRQRPDQEGGRRDHV